MANNKFYGYTPDISKEKEGNRLNQLNPYEFRKGMDYELTAVGCSRLAESTLEEREKATENVLKNLEEHSGYYSALIQFEGGMDHGAKITETTFKKYLENYKSEYPGTGMVEVDKEIKDDKMVELKETIKNRVREMLRESGGKVDGREANLNKQIEKAAKSKLGMSLEKIKANLIKLQDKKKALETKRKGLFSSYKEKIKGEDDPTKIEKELEKYKTKAKPIQDEINDIDKEFKNLNNLEEEARGKSKILRREAAKTMMEKDVHMELLNIIKESGISLMEGSAGVKVYYEIAKKAYMEGIMAGLKH